MASLVSVFYPLIALTYLGLATTTWHDFSTTKTKVVRPTNGKKKKLKKKLSEYLKRGKAIARPLAVTIKRVNEIVRGWINYFRIGMMKQFIEEFWEWLRHKIRVKVMKQWKNSKTIYRNLCYLNRKNRRWSRGAQYATLLSLTVFF